MDGQHAFTLPFRPAGSKGFPTCRFQPPQDVATAPTEPSASSARLQRPIIKPSRRLPQGCMNPQYLTSSAARPSSAVRPPQPVVRRRPTQSSQQPKVLIEEDPDYPPESEGEGGVESEEDEFVSEAKAYPNLPLQLVDERAVSERKENESLSKDEEGPDSGAKKKRRLTVSDPWATYHRYGFLPVAVLAGPRFGPGEGRADFGGHFALSYLRGGGLDPLWWIMDGKVPGTVVDSGVWDCGVELAEEAEEEEEDDDDDGSDGALGEENGDAEMEAEEGSDVNDSDDDEDGSDSEYDSDHDSLISKLPSAIFQAAGNYE
jgi:hypothetical protein